MNEPRKTIPEQLSDALAEVDRLRAENQSAHAAGTKLNEALSQLETLRAENASLRSALATTRSELTAANTNLQAARGQIKQATVQSSAPRPSVETRSAADVLNSDQLRQQATIEAFVDRKKHEAALMAKSAEYMRKKLGIS